MSRRTETAYKAIIRASQHNMTKSHGFRRNGKCCGCVATVRVLIRGDLSRLPLFSDGAATGNGCRDGAGVSRGHIRRRMLPPVIRQLETSPASSQIAWKSYPAEGPNDEEEVSPNELS